MTKLRIRFISILMLTSFVLFIGNYSSILAHTEEINSSQSYTPEFNALNVKEPMTLSPIFTPDNAIIIYVGWINQANTTIDVQNQYITQWDSSDWTTDNSPLVNALVNAKNRGVTIRVQVNEDTDSDNITKYFQSLDIEVRWMGTSASQVNGTYLTYTHNKLILIDEKVTLLSSINFGENAFTNNREAGMVIQSPTIARYYTRIFEEDWADGEIPPVYSPYVGSGNKPITIDAFTYTSHTNIPRTNFTGTYNVSLFSNPDSADEIIFQYLSAAQTSIYVSMYTISRTDFTDTLINLKKANPVIDIQVLISYRRVSSYENEDTREAAETLVANGIPVYNSTTDDDKVDNYYHNKYWIIDGTDVFVYSGNWASSSVTPSEDVSSSSNRDMGIAVHEAPDIAAFFKNVWNADVAVGTEWESEVGLFTSLEDADIISGQYTLQVSFIDAASATISYRVDDGSYQDIGTGNGSFSTVINTREIENGIHTIEVKAETTNGSYTSESIVNAVNYGPDENWRFLITEVVPNPEGDDTLGEYIELTNSFPFELYIEGWQVGDDSNLHTFVSGYTFDAYSSIIIARDSTGFQSAFSVSADIELSSLSLVNTQDYVQLINSRGQLIDVVAYGAISAPDGSEVLTAPDSGIALKRSPLHIDTNTASDFTHGPPDPKGTVPEIELNTGTSPLPTTTDEDSPFPWGVSIVVLIILTYKKRR